jgi:hypothetical protein
MKKNQFFKVYKEEKMKKGGEKNMRKMIISIEIIIALILASVLVGATFSVSNETTSIGGQVTKSDGQPISGAIIIAHSNHKTEYAISDDSGWYVLNNIPIFEEIKITCTKTHYKTFRTSIYIDMLDICPILNIELQKKNNNIGENSIVQSNILSSYNKLISNLLLKNK